MSLQRGQKNDATSAPSENGPDTHGTPPRNWHAIGIATETYSPTTDKLKIALMAVGPANARRPRMKATKDDTQMQFTDVRVQGFIRYSMWENGKPPSRANANIWREQETSSRIVSRKCEGGDGFELTYQARTCHEPSKPLGSVAMSRWRRDCHSLNNNDDRPYSQCQLRTKAIEQNLWNSQHDAKQADKRLD